MCMRTTEVIHTARTCVRCRCILLKVNIVVFFLTANHSLLFPQLTNHNSFSVALSLVYLNFDPCHWSIPKREHPVPYRRTFGPLQKNIRSLTGEHPVPYRRSSSLLQENIRYLTGEHSVPYRRTVGFYSHWLIKNASPFTSNQSLSIRNHHSVCLVFRTIPFL